MREIKFRVWNKLKKDWEDCDLTQISEEHPFPLNDLFESDYCIFQQFTGLKDKNGKEIYEGDIVKIISSVSPLRIGFQLGCFCYEFLDDGGFYSWVGATKRQDIEIIGNVFENIGLCQTNEDKKD